MLRTPTVDDSTRVAPLDLSAHRRASEGCRRVGAASTTVSPVVSGWLRASGKLPAFPNREQPGRATLAIAAALMAVACAAGSIPLVGILRGYLTFIDLSVYLLAVHAGAVPLYLAMRPRKPDVALFLFAWGILSIVAAYAAGSAPSPAIVCGILVVAGGSVALFRLAVASVRESSEKRALARQALLAVFGLLATVAVSRILLVVISHSLPVTFDRYLYACDAGFGAQVSFAIGRLFSIAPPLREFCLLVYVGLPFGVLFLFANLRAKPRVRWLLLAHFTLIGIAGRFCYSAVPATGPIYHFAGRFPWNPPALASLAVEPVQLSQGLRNAMPSLHVAWALMLLWWTFGQKLWLRASAGLFLLLTLLATLGLGEHYLIDLIVAVPFSVGTFAVIAALLPGHRIPWAALAVGLGLSALWLVLLRSSAGLLAGQPQVVWPLSASTLALSLWVRPWRRLPPPPLRQ